MKKLNLNKITLTTLTEDMMRAVKGGETETIDTYAGNCTEVQCPTGPTGCGVCETVACTVVECTVVEC